VHQLVIKRFRQNSLFTLISAKKK